MPLDLPEGTQICAGPVIIEDGKVLLNREQKPDGVTPFLFPGGRVEDFSLPLEDTAKREAMEELGIEIEIIKPLRTLLANNLGGPKRMYILTHFLARRVGEINPGPETVEWGWFDINNLPENCEKNVFEIINDIKADFT